ncbi:phosphate signaling complex protein PhoU [Cellulosimicrobium arenosum]|uniref:Phosphate-specific transport system accessory protein PhoU n=1 Tax=Cellulosimicrobium arenosum TaxID=2708133 RepID=A0A927G8V9_9MICO|nr:phosphate signaling complex protein PhoU [Cellulosimicrobium arenosum]MBD8079108.1 phosphate signaling complex protein PhoU [Cellulosimicrobium arenosum]
MREIFEAELKQVGDDLAEMSRLVETAVGKAGQALLTADLQLAQQVIAADHTIDALENELDERCVYLLAQQAPVATDLRVVVSALRMSATLERMGDLARHIAQVARGRYPSHAIEPSLHRTFEQMSDAAVRVARRTTTLLTTRDLTVASNIERDDDLLDHLHQDTFVAMLDGTWSATTQETVDVTLVARYYERFGDHGVSIAKRVTYLVTGDFADDRAVPSGTAGATA